MTYRIAGSFPVRLCRVSGVLAISLALIQGTRADAQYHFLTSAASRLGADTTQQFSLNGVDGKIAVGSYTDFSGVQHGYTYDLRSYVTGSFDVTGATSGTTANGTSGGTVVGTYNVGEFGLGSASALAYFRKGLTYTTLDAANYDSTVYFGSPGSFGWDKTEATGVSGNLVVGTYYRDTFSPFLNGVPNASGFIFDTNTNTFTEIDQPDTLVDALGSGSGGTHIDGIYGTTAVGNYFDVSGAEHGLLYDISGVAFTTIDNPLADGGTTLTGIYGDYAVGEYVLGGASYGFTYNMLTQTYETLVSPGDASTAYFTGAAASLDSHNLDPILTGYTIDRYGNYNAFWYQAVTPEPGSYALFGGLLTAGLVLRRKRRK